ncbi:MAG: hypothetical protein IJR14_01790 [Synergistaceae bacterium]|nr:hypothetical protein [Synergistaceae bacterium]
MKKISVALLALSLSVVSPIPAGAWWLWVSGYPVQEGTQLGRLAASVKEIAEQLEMIKQHLAMLKSLKGQLLQLGTGQIMDAFMEAQSVIKQAETLASGISDFGSAFKEHFPDYDLPGIISMSEEGKRLDDQWRKASEGYLKALNMTAKGFQDEQRARDRMMEVLTEADPESGQTKAIQVIGAMIAHAAFLTDRSNYELGGFVENYLTRKQMEREKRKIARENGLKMTRYIEGREPTGKSYTPGFKK